MGGYTYSKTCYKSAPVNERSAVVEFRVVFDRLADRRQNGDPMDHSGVDVRLVDGTRCFVHRFKKVSRDRKVSFDRPAGHTRHDESDPIRYLQDPVWREPKWRVTLAELKYAGNYGEFGTTTNNCLHATQRMARAMGWLDEVQHQIREWVREGRLDEQALEFML